MMVLRRLYSRRAGPDKLMQKAKRDPGIFQQKKVLQESPDEIEFTDFDELESDFMTVHKSHKEHVQEIEAIHEKQKYLIVKQKYFKDKFPNFLTWHDKEQIRYLYHNFPEEWPIERLSEGFPALPEVVEKIIKNKWTKSNQTKISNHDRVVLKNWKDFKHGKLNNMPIELKEHLKKFSDRTLNFEPFKMTEGKEIVIQSEQHKSSSKGEFSEIIASYQRLKDLHKENAVKSVDLVSFDNTNDSKNIKSKVKKDLELLTFKELQGTVEHKLSKGEELTIQDKLLKKASFPKKEDASLIELRQEDISKIVEHRRETNSGKVGFVRKTTRDMSHLVYPDRIVIAEDIYKRGHTYKLNDCYYDSDGEFLYRVPGMG